MSVNAPLAGAGGPGGPDRLARRSRAGVAGVARTSTAGRFRWLGALPLMLMVAVMAGLALMTLANAGARHGGAREQLFDLYERLFPAKIDRNSPIHVVEIDRESIEKIGPWPWPRSLIAELVETSAGAGAKGVLYLEGVDSPDPLSPETIGDFWLAGARDERLAQQLALLPSTDLMLARAMSRTKGAVAIGPSSVARDAARLVLERADAGVNKTISPSADSFFGLPAARPRAPVNADLASAAAVTVSALPADSDGVARMAPLLWSSGGRLSVASALEAARIASGAATITVHPDPSAVTAVGKSPVRIDIAGASLSVDAMASTRLYFPRRIDTPTTPAWKLLRERSALSLLSGKVVMIGLDDVVGQGVATARGEMSMPRAQAILARQLIAGETLKRPGWFGYLEALLVLALGAAAIMWSQRLDFWKAAGVAALASAVLLAVSVGLFAQGGFLFDPLAPALALFLGAFTVAGGRSIGEAIKDDKVRGAYQGALPEPTMKKVREEGKSEVLDGVKRPVTVLACELSLLDEDAEKLSDTPGEITALIAAGCAHLKKAIIEVGGAADQADGGRIFAYFNAPLENADHVRDACAGALRLIESMDRINLELQAAPHLKGVQLHLAIGIATGDCFLGPMGQGRAQRYSAVGRPMALAAFLSRQAMVYGPAIIVDEAVHKRIDHHFAFLELDRVKEMGTDRAFSIFALVGNPFLKSSKGFRSLEEVNRAMQSAYREGDWLAARANLAKARQLPGTKIALFDLYEARIAKMAEAEGGAKTFDGAQVVTL
jgi:adenylate cyclase